MSYLKKNILIITISLLPLSIFADSSMGESIGFIRWSDSMALTRSKLEMTFGSAVQDSSAGTVQSMGLFAGESADIICHYSNLINLTAIQFTIDSKGEGREAYVGYDNAYATLQELYGSPTTIDVFTGERLWSFSDGSSISLRTSRKVSDESRKTKGTLSGEGSIKGQSRTLGRDGGRTEADYRLNFNPSYNSEGLLWDGEQIVKMTEVKTVVSFNRPMLVSADDPINQGEQRAIPISPTAPRP